jgi:hypothetical protein
VVGEGPPGWTTTVMRAAFTVLAVAIVAVIVWKLLSRLLPVLLVIVALVFVYRLALSGGRRSGW